jgi:predicted Zn-dependent peptidase
MALCGGILVGFLGLASIVVGGSPTAEETTGGLSPVETVMDCGAQALLWPRPGSGTVLITVAVPAGSQNEPVEMAGLSHYLEHLLFDGFDDFDERGVTEAFEQRSAYVNAFTRDQATIFFALAPVEEAQETARLLTGMLTRSKIVPATYEKERKVILEELAKDNTNPDQVKEERLRSALWRGTPLEQPVGGFEKTVAATDRETVVRYWKDRYGPSSWRILITGDLPIEGLQSVLDSMAPLDASPALPRPSDPLQWAGWGQWEAEEAPGKSGGPAMDGMPPMGAMGHGGRPASTGPGGGTLALLIAAPEGARRTEMEIVARWLGDAQGPLQTALIPGFANSIGVSLQPRFSRDVLRIDIDAIAEADPEDLLGRLLGALNAAAAGPDDGDVVRIQRAWQAERVLTGQRLHYAAMFYGEALATARDGLPESVDPPMVTLEAVRRTSGALLKAETGRRRAAWIGPGGPTERIDLPKAQETQLGTNAANFDESPFGSQLTTLPNGLVLGILPETGGEVFGIHLLVADRSLREPSDLPGIADYLHRLLPAGTSVSGSREIERRLARAGIELKAGDSPMIPFDNRYHVPDFSYVRLEGPARSLETGLALLAEMIRQPQWDSDGIRAAGIVHTQSIGADNRGGALAGRQLYAALLGPDHPLAQPVSGVPGDLPDIETVREFWGDWPDGYFASNRLVLTIASPQPVEQTLEIVEDVFSGGEARTPERGPYPIAQPVETTTKAGDAPQITMLWGRRFDVPASERAAFLVAVDALSDRMVAVIREKEGLAYRLGAGVRDLPGGQWLLAARVGTRPENEARVTQLMHEIVQKLSSDPLPQEELERFAARDRRSKMLRGLSAASRAYRLGRALFEGDTSPLRVDSAERAAVTPAAVQAAATKYLGLDGMELVIAR